jgi:fibro-slime domain-containing protein
MRAALLLLLAACTPPEDPTPPADDRGPGCAYAGFDATPFQDAATEVVIGEVVPDFGARTLGGDRFQLSEAWGDCSMFTLVPYHPNFDRDDLDELIDDSEPFNTYLFFSRGSDPQADMRAVRDRVDAYLERKRRAFREAWEPRFVYLTAQADNVDVLAATAEVTTDYFVIDADQRLRDAGSYRTFNGDFVPFLPMARYGSRWFAYERRTAERLAAQEQDPDVLVVPWMREGYVETADGALPVELPSAEEMARFDRMEIVVKETCEPGSRFPVHYGGCPAWDVGHKITLCDDETTCVSREKNQLYRMVTGYHSGVWLYEDVSHGLPWFKEGGTRWLRSDRGDFHGTIEFRFFDDGEVAPEQDLTDARHLIDMGRSAWDAAHNEGFPDYRFTPPPGTVRVVMDARVQGGGNNQPSGCAEFCSHTHTVEVGGQSFEHTFEMKNTADCAARVAQGVTAGQFGTWFLDRGSWCPGGPVERWQQDLTEVVDLSGPNTIRWTGSYDGDTWPPGGGTTATVWLAFYGGDGTATIERLPRETCANPPSVTLRDFSNDHPDFKPLSDAWRALEDGDAAKEEARGTLTGVVADTLDADGKPVLVWPEGALPYTTADSFADWWRDSDASHTTDPLPNRFHRTRMGTFGRLISNGDHYAEFPLLAADFGHGSEDVVFNTEGGVPVNSSYTVEIAGPFVHREGVRLRLGTRADLFVFLDGALVFESGGFVGKGFPKNILDLDDLDLTVGETYDLRIFGVVGRDGGAGQSIWLEHPACD